MKVYQSEFPKRSDRTVEELDARLELLRIANEQLTEWPNPETIYPATLTDD